MALVDELAFESNSDQPFFLVTLVHDHHHLECGYIVVKAYGLNCITDLNLISSFDAGSRLLGNNGKVVLLIQQKAVIVKYRRDLTQQLD